MGQPYVGEIRLFAGNFAPVGWAHCMGQLMPISENETLFALLGTTYGGDGQETFGLPNLAGRAPVHMGQISGSGQTYQIGETGGVENVTLSLNQIPNHNHALLCTSNQATQNQPANSVLAQSPTQNALPYGTDLPIGNMNAAAVSSVGGSQPHDNMQPYVTMSYIIALFGVFPHT